MHIFSIILVTILALLFVGSFASAAVQPDGFGLTAENLRCNYHTDPIGIDKQNPQLSWILTSNERNERQTAYQILVASSEAKLIDDEADNWDSGKVISSNSIHVDYAGKPLRSNQSYFWKVRAWDSHGRAGNWSTPARWETAALSPEDWHAQWIEAKNPEAKSINIKVISANYRTVDGTVNKDVTSVIAQRVTRHGADFIVNNTSCGGDPSFNNVKELDISYSIDGVTYNSIIAENARLQIPQATVPYLRKSFVINGNVKKARIWATALGVYELHMNGHRVGDQYLAPGWTDYFKRLYYQVYDVTNELRKGENVFGAMVAPGWYAGHAGIGGVQSFYGDTPALIAQLEITMADGTVQRIVTDGSWKIHDGPITLADIQKGENYDAVHAISNWDMQTLNDSSWASATIRPETRNLQSDFTNPVRITGKIACKTVREPLPGHWTFDLGQNMVGVVSLDVNEPRGTKLTLRHAEMLNPDGTVYTANLRSATSTDSYTCSGDGNEVWHPRFTYHGFRYVEITGLTSKPSVGTVTGLVLGSDLPRVGEFSCSKPEINQLQSNIWWGLRGNYLSVPTDCPQRDERMGWTADAQVFLPTAIYNVDAASFFAKWMVDVDDAQRADGAETDVAPAMGGLGYGTPAWGDAGVIVPWTIYQAYGDKNILAKHIESMQRWVDWCTEHSTNLIRDRDRGNDYGDWLSIGADTPHDLIGTAYFAYSTHLLSKSMAVLGHTADADKYAKQFEEIKTAFNQKYVRSDGQITGNTQCAYLLGLKFDLLPQSLRSIVTDRLVADIKQRDWRLSTGFVGVSYLLPVLAEAGREDVAYRLLFQDQFPSWLFSVKQGATTIWERWDGWTPENGFQNEGMNSFNHYSLGSCGEWLFEGVGGIKSDPSQPGFSHVFIKPLITADLTFANARYQSIHGLIASEWVHKDGLLTMHTIVPVNVHATVYVPSKNASEVLENGRPLAEAIGVKFVRQDTSATVLEIGSGSYSFTVPMHSP